MQEREIHNRGERGFTLIELLIAIVVVGILAAVAIVGIAGLTNTGGKSACTATADAAKAASAAFYANQSPNAWPTSFDQMVTDSAAAPVNSPPVLELSNGVTAAGDTVTNGDWNLVGVFPGTGTAPTFDPKASGNCKTP